MKQRSDFRFIEPLRVRWAEVDMQKIVFNGHYLMYFDTAVAGYWRALAMPYHETMEAVQGDLFVRKATLEYEASARYDEQLGVGIRCARIGKSSLVFEAAVFRGDQRLVHGELVYVFANPATQTSQPVPELLRDWFLGFDGGQDMVTLERGDWATLGAATLPLREAVYAQELGVPASDEADGTALHVLLRNRLGLAVASGRLGPAADGIAQVGRLATLAPLRGAGFGHQVLAALLQAARQRGDRELVATALIDAVPFWARAGFVRAGDVFHESGHAHQRMRLALA
jgi:YbgC/YbaW family acyl-CoA thioester hydrolase